MKLTQEQLLILAKTVGIQDVQLVEDEKDSEFDLDVALQSIDSNRSTILKPQFEQELRADLEKSIAGKVGGTLESGLKRTLGCPSSIFTPDMKDPQRIEAALNWKVAQLDGSVQDAQKEIASILEKHQADMDATKQDYEAKLSEANQKYIDRDIQEFIQGRLKDAPLPTTSDRAVVTKDFVQHLRSKYHLNYDEAKKQVDLHLKDNPSMLALNENKTKPIEILAEAEQFFSPRGLWMKDMRHEAPANHMPANAQGYKSANGQQPSAAPLTKLQEQLAAKTAAVPQVG